MRKPQPMAIELVEAGRGDRAEFYVKPGSRRLGCGRDAIASIWRRYPGAWELQVHARNVAGLRFWASCIAPCADDPPDVKEIKAEDGRRIQFNFCIAIRGNPHPPKGAEDEGGRSAKSTAVPTAARAPVGRAPQG